MNHSPLPWKINSERSVLGGIEFYYVKDAENNRLCTCGTREQAKNIEGLGKNFERLKEAARKATLRICDFGFEPDAISQLREILAEIDKEAK